MADKTPEQMLEEARKFIGMESAPFTSPFPVEYDPIIRYCHMVGETDPLFLDPEYAKNTPHGAVIAPPLFMRTPLNGQYPWLPQAKSHDGRLPTIPTPGDRSIGMTTEFELLKPVKVGDRITTSQRIADVFLKGIRADPKAFWTVTETIFRNQDNEVVQIERHISLKHRTPEQVKAAGDA